jgi:hypothetical protein
MWVIVSERVGDRYIGVLDNRPHTVPPVAGEFYLKEGVEVPFAPRDVLEIAHPDPPRLFAWWALRRPKERWRR